MTKHAEKGGVFLPWKPMDAPAGDTVQEQFEDQESHRRKFTSLSPAEIAALVRKHGRPKVGVFVPDGTKRLGLALSNALPGTDDFLSRTATLSIQYAQDNLRVFFDHGLETLLVPMFSKSVLARGERYRQDVALKILEMLFRSEDWLEFYRTYQIQVRVYGDKDFLREVGCRVALPWIAATQELTVQHQRHILLYGIGGDPWVGAGLAELGVRFFQERGRMPTYEEQVEAYYGKPVKPADFFIMSTKLSGAGALPPLICGRETAMYFLIAPGVWALTPEVYKEIVYDLIFLRNYHEPEGVARTSALQQAEALQDYYTSWRTVVIGLGRIIGGTWTPKGDWEQFAQPGSQPFAEGQNRES
jgi:hypothetical protein